MKSINHAIPAAASVVVTVVTCALAMTPACDDAPNDTSPDAAVDAPAPDAPVVVECPAPTGQEIVHQTDITTNETWAGDGTVHRIAFGITIRPGGTLTVAPCAHVIVNSGLILSVTGSEAAGAAKLIANGDAAHPIRFTSSVATEKWGGWRGLNALASFELSYVTLENGGNGGTNGSALNLTGGGAAATASIPLLKADHLVIKDAAGTGLVLEGGAAFTADSTDLTVIGGGPGANASSGYAIELTPVAANTLPVLHVSGNNRDAIRITNSSIIAKDVTLKDLGVPFYFYFDRVRITDPTAATTPTLTIEPGVEVRFDDYLQIGFFNLGLADQPGKLLALGTAANPIVFTSSKVAPAAGDWPGIFLMNAAGSRLEHVEIKFAGGFNGISSANCKPADSTDHAALFIGGKTVPYIPLPTDFVAVDIESSASHGINAMWETAGDYAPVLAGSFTFTSILGCRQTKNATTQGCVGGQGCTVP